MSHYLRILIAYIFFRSILTFAAESLVPVNPHSGFLNCLVVQIGQRLRTEFKDRHLHRSIWDHEYRDLNYSDYQSALDRRDYKAAALAAQKYGDHVEAAHKFGRAGMHDEARAEVVALKAEYEKLHGKKMNAHLATTRWSNDPRIIEIETKVHEALPLALGLSDSLHGGGIADANYNAFDITDTMSCSGKCSIYSNDLTEALNAIGVPAKVHSAYVPGNRMGHYFIMLGDYLIDPSIQQIIKHPEMRGVFVGTKAEVANFLNAHPESLVRDTPQETIEWALRSYYDYPPSKRRK